MVALSRIGLTDDISPIVATEKGIEVGTLPRNRDEPVDLLVHEIDEHLCTGELEYATNYLHRETSPSKGIYENKHRRRRRVGLQPIEIFNHNLRERNFSADINTETRRKNTGGKQLLQMASPSTIQFRENEVNRRGQDVRHLRGSFQSDDGRTILTTNVFARASEPIKIVKLTGCPYTKNRKPRTQVATQYLMLRSSMREKIPSLIGRSSHITPSPQINERNQTLGREKPPAYHRAHARTDPAPQTWDANHPTA